MRKVHHSPNAEKYPRIYQPNRYWRTCIFISSGVLTIGGIAGILYAVLGHFEATTARVCSGVIFSAMALFGVYCVLANSRSRVILFADQISIDELASRKVFRRNEIRGWRILASSPPTFVIEPVDPHRSRAKFSLMFRRDEQFSGWFESIPALGDKDAARSKTEILEDPALGPTRQERSETLKHAQERARILSGIALAITLWGLFYPHPYRLVIFLLVPVPWIALELARRSHGLMRVDELKNDAHPNIATPLMFPGIVLVLRSALDFNVIQSWFAVTLYFAIGAALAFAIFAVDPSQRTRKLVSAFLCLLCIGYAYGAVVETNCLLDPSKGVEYNSTVLGKHISSGKHTSYILELAAWGPKTTTNEIDVGRKFYDEIEKGDSVTLALCKGTLGIRWYYISYCQRTRNALPDR